MPIHVNPENLSLQGHWEGFEILESPQKTPVSAFPREWSILGTKIALKNQFFTKSL